MGKKDVDKEFYYLEMSNALIKAMKGWAKAADHIASLIRVKYIQNLSFSQFFQWITKEYEDNKW